MTTTTTNIGQKELPAGWKWVKLGDVCRFTGGSSLPNNEDCPEIDRVYLLKVSGLTRNFCDGKYLTRATGYTSRSLLRSRVVESPAIVFPKRGGAIAKNRKVMTSIPAALDPNLMAIDTHSKTEAHLEYLYWWLNSFDLSSIQTGTSVPQINRQDLAPLSIPLPPLREQKEISDRLNGAEGIRKTNAESDKKIEELKSSLLQRAFRGEL